MEHTYDYCARGANSLFEVRMPEDLTAVDRLLVTESVMSLDVHLGEIIMRCKNPYLACRPMPNLKKFMGTEKRMYDSEMVCGQYKKPFEIVEFERDGTITKVRVYENPSIGMLDDTNDKDADAIYIIKYTSTYCKVPNDL
jgi:hypothetical protein